MGTAAPLSKICAAELAPGSAVRTDHELRDYIRGTWSAPITRQGPARWRRRGEVGERLDGVTDPQLRVRGVRGLRIVDASVLPTLPRGNTNAPVIAIAERAADLIAGRAPLAPLVPVPRSWRRAPGSG